MYKQAKIDEVNGKTVEKLSYGNDEMIISFTDKTFIHISIYGEDVEYMYLNVYKNTMNSVSMFSVDAGIATQEEYEIAKQERQEKREQEWEDRERKQYEELKRKFE
ncbi:MAG: hypothetical protein GY804_11555 [Alphaproteobacteria bacterium]|nr:hypothetical protein [Alphaproteobacteria bacterium]